MNRPLPPDISSGMGARDEQNWDETPRMLRADVSNLIERVEALEEHLWPRREAKPTPATENPKPLPNHEEYLHRNIDPKTLAEMVNRCAKKWWLSGVKLDEMEVLAHPLVMSGGDWVWTDIGRIPIRRTTDHVLTMRMTSP